MPNHCENTLVFKGSVEDLKAFEAAHLRPNPERPEELVFDFNDFIPMPPSLDVVEGSESLDAYDLFFDSWSRVIERPLFKEHAPAGGYSSREEVIAVADQHAPDMRALAMVLKSNEELYGSRTWYRWCNKNWGTKWNAYDAYCEGVVIPEVGLKKKTTTLTLSFTTAWSPPVPVLRAIAQKYPQLSFKVKWREEGGDRGRFSAKNGVLED